jgi:DHA3 family tetracycline resistance protein-like MFS transporter
LLISGVTAFAGACAFTLNLVYQVQTVGLGPLELVLAGTALEVTCLVAQLPTGIIADLYSRRLSVIVGVLLTGAGTLLEGLVPAFLAILGGSVLWGIGATCLDGALEAWAADEIGEDRIGHVLTRGAQVGQAATVLGLGTAVALASVRLNLPLVAGACAWLALGLALTLIMPERPFPRTSVGAVHLAPSALASGMPGSASPGVGSGGSASSGSVPAGPVDVGPDSGGSGVVAAAAARPGQLGGSVWGALRAMGGQLVAGSRAVRGRPVLLFLLAATGFIGLASEGIDRLGQAHFLIDLGFPAIGSPVMWLGVLSVAAMVGSIALTEFVRRRTLRPGRVFVLFEAATVLAVLVFALAGRFWLAAIAWVAIDLLRSACRPLMSTWIVANTESATRATVFSAAGMVDAAGEIGGGPPVGFIGQRLSIRAALVASGLLLAPAVGFLAAALAHTSSPVRFPRKLRNLTGERDLDGPAAPGEDGGPRSPRRWFLRRS